MRTRKKKKKKKKKLVCVRACVFFGTHQTESQSRAFITRARGWNVAVAFFIYIYIYVKRGGLKMPLASRLGFRPGGRGHRTRRFFAAPNVFPFLLASLLCYAMCDQVHALNTWPIKLYKNATVY